MYTLKLADGKEISNLKWSAGRFWTDEDLRSQLTQEQLKLVTVSTDEDIITDYEDEKFTGDFFLPGEYKNMAYYDYRKREGVYGLWAFYIDRRREDE